EETLALETAEGVDGELHYLHGFLHDRLDRRVTEEEVELRSVRRSIDVTRAETHPRLHEQRKRRVVRQCILQPRRRRRNPTFLEQDVREVLVREPLDDVRIGEQDQGVELVAGTCEDELVEICQRYDELHVVLAHDVAERRDVIAVLYPREELVAVRVIESRREGVHV